MHPIMQVFQTRQYYNQMYYTTERKRSRLASVGGNTLNYSSVSRVQPMPTNPPHKFSQPEEEFLSIPNYSGFRTRNTDALRDFHMEIEDRYRTMKPRERMYRPVHTEPAQQHISAPSHPFSPQQLPPTQRTDLYGDMLRRQDLKSEVSQLKVMMSKLLTNRDKQLDDEYLQRKISRLMPKKQTQQQFYPPPPPPQPQFIPIPIYQPPPPQYPPPYPYPSQYPQAPPASSYQQPPEKPKKKFNAGRKLRKVFFSVAFPYLLKAYSKKLAKLRHMKFKEQLESSLQTCTLEVRNWFLETTNKAMSIIIDKNDVSMDFRNESDVMLLQQKLYLFCEVVESLTNGLLNNTKQEHLENFSEFLAMTCCNHSYSADNFFTERQISYLSFSEDFSYLSITKPVQQCQLIAFVFMKMIVYNLLLQPWKFDEALRGSEVTVNLYLVASFLYNCCCQMIEKRLGEKEKVKGGWKRGNMAGKYEHSTFIYKNAQNNPEEIISGMASRKEMAKAEKFNNGKCWKNSIERLEKVIQKIHKQVIITYKEAHKELLENEANP